MTIENIESMVAMVPNLIHLELDLGMLFDETNGYRWESFVFNLKIFDFRYHHSSLLFHALTQNEILAAYRTPFWLDHKHWFVVHDNNGMTTSVFTVPRFAPKNMIWPFNTRSRVCTSSSICLEQYMNCLTWSLDIGLDRFVLPNITSLELVKGNSFSTEILLSLADVFYQLPQLNSLALEESLLIYFPTKIVFQQIRTLVIYDMNQKRNLPDAVDAQYLSYAFPRLEKINIPLNSSQDLFYLLDALKYLSFATFRCRFNHGIFSDAIQNKTLSRYWLICGSRRLWANRSFTSRIKRNTINLWVSLLSTGSFTMSMTGIQ
ncbi:unnamed protein product [Rotaria sp. Silwood1]|nr:unnamed protein product [Rotaria sp. Silwood1]